MTAQADTTAIRTLIEKRMNYCAYEMLRPSSRPTRLTQ
jgi:hypothetical protein